MTRRKNDTQNILTLFDDGGMLIGREGHILHE